MDIYIYILMILNNMVYQWSFWLVVDLPLWKMEFVSWEGRHPIYYGKSKNSIHINNVFPYVNHIFMINQYKIPWFQTTNQMKTWWLHHAWWWNTMNNALKSCNNADLQTGPWCLKKPLACGSKLQKGSAFNKNWERSTMVAWFEAANIA